MLSKFIKAVHTTGGERDTAQSVASTCPMSTLPQWILIIIAITHLSLCADYYERRWDIVASSCANAVEYAGEGLVIQWNGLGYYAWLRSLLIDQDWDFENEFDDHNPCGEYVPPPSYRTPLGRRANQWSIGPSCIWAVTVVPGHFVLKILEGGTALWPTNGYSLPYQLLVGMTSLAVSFTGLVFVYRICRTQARPARAALAVALLILGTGAIYYSAIEISLPHGVGTAVLAGAVWYWLTTYGSLRPGRWLLVGILIGVAALVRWQLATFAILPGAEAVFASYRRGRVGAAIMGICTAGMVLAFMPQLLAWRCVYGAWFVNPIQGVKYHWLTPSFWTILCSQDRSLFYWTPVTMLACFGAFGCLKPTKRQSSGATDVPLASSKEPLWILGIAFLIQVYALAGMWGKGEPLESIRNFGGVFLARSYGFRDLTESLIVLAPGFAWLLEHVSLRRLHALGGLGLFLVMWNLILVNLYTNAMIPPDAGLNLATLIIRALELGHGEPSVLLDFFGNWPTKTV